MDIAVEIQYLNKSYGKMPVLKGLSFSIRKGEIFGLLGPNGAGKTTTLNIIEGLKPPDSGTVNVLGMDILADARKVKSRIGVQLQATSLMSDLTVVEQVMLLGVSAYGIQLIHLR